MLTVFIGNNDIELSTIAKQHTESAYLIDHSNYTQQHSGTCYTSIADLPGLAEFASILRQADEIIYYPSKKWTSDELKDWTEYYINVFALDKGKKVIAENLLEVDDLDTILTLNSKRKNSGPGLWVSGCSISIGAGVKPNESYADLLASKLNLPLYMLGYDGASISYSADQLLRSDIQKDDVVIFGITSEHRMTFYSDESSLLHINIRTYKKYSEFNKIINFEFLDSKTMIYSSVISVYQVINFCKKIGAKLILAGLLPSPTLARYFKNLPEYIHLHNYYGIEIQNLFKDFGDDGEHPGPEMHKWYATKILEKIRENDG